MDNEVFTDDRHKRPELGCTAAAPSCWGSTLHNSYSAALQQPSSHCTIHTHTHCNSVHTHTHCNSHPLHNFIHTRFWTANMQELKWRMSWETLHVKLIAGGRTVCFLSCCSSKKHGYGDGDIAIRIWGHGVRHFPKTIIRGYGVQCS